MLALKIFIILYLIAGFIYALYLLVIKSSEWYWLPINIIGGPIIILYTLYFVIRKKGKPITWG
ncbi:hypothetical protein ACFL15_01415 [Patescibacteria group bacterium]